MILLTIYLVIVALVFICFAIEDASELLFGLAFAIMWPVAALLGICVEITAEIKRSRYNKTPLGIIERKVREKYDILIDFENDEHKYLAVDQLIVNGIKSPECFMHIRHEKKNLNIYMEAETPDELIKLIKENILIDEMREDKLNELLNGTAL